MRLSDRRFKYTFSQVVARSDALRITSLRRAMPVSNRRGSGSKQTLARSNRSVSQHVTTVTSSWPVPCVCSAINSSSNSNSRSFKSIQRDRIDRAKSTALRPCSVSELSFSDNCRARKQSKQQVFSGVKVSSWPTSADVPIKWIVGNRTSSGLRRTIYGQHLE
jgi:hypothetical protein